jgi:Uncharacterized protein conserved in bacteria (DUF2171)
MTMDPVRNIRPGIEVHTLDGEKIGTVKEVRDGALKVDAPMRPDFWLPRSLVLSWTNERVTMDFNQADLFEHALSEDEAERAG